MTGAYFLKLYLLITQRIPLQHEELNSGMENSSSLPSGNSVASILSSQIMSASIVNTQKFTNLNDFSTIGKDDFPQVYMNSLEVIHQYSITDIQGELNKMSMDALCYLRGLLCQSLIDIFPQYGDRRIIRRTVLRTVVGDITTLGLCIVNQNANRDLEKIFLAPVSAGGQLGVFRNASQVGEIQDNLIASITEAVDASVEESINSIGGLRGKISSSQTQHDHNTRNTNGESGGKMESTIVSEILGQLIPVLTNAISTAVAASTRELLTRIAKSAQTGKVQHLQREVQLHKFELDKLEQYSRKENIKVFGLPETEGENTNEKVVNLAREMGLEIGTRDISISHRIRGAAGKPRPIIVKFVRRETKAQVMKHKRNLKKKPEFRDVFINDDLTKLRGKIMYQLKSDENIIKQWSVDGKIFCVMKEGNREIKKTIDSPEDLSKLGWTDEKVKELGVYFTF